MTIEPGILGVMVFQINAIGKPESGRTTQREVFLLRLLFSKLECQSAS